MFYLERIQRLIHLIEEGAVSRWIKMAPLVVVVLALAFLYDLRAYRGFFTSEAMDAAQVARNLADGKGYSTDYIRPFSIYLVKQHNETSRGLQLTNFVDYARLNRPHPDLANAPAYPTLLAGLMKLANPEWKISSTPSFWSPGGNYTRYQPEFIIAVLNQFLLFIAVALTFVLAKKLFDGTAAWLAVLLMLASSSLWQFSVSGLSTIFLLVIFLGLLLCLAQYDRLGSRLDTQPGKWLALAITIGLLLGLGTLTRYSFGWLIVPVVVYLVLAGGGRKSVQAVTTVLVFAAVIIPWLIRNYSIGGTFFGTAGYAMTEDTYVYPGSLLMQSIHPNLTLAFAVRPILHKLLNNADALLQHNVFQLGGGWLGILFFAGLLLGLRNVTARRLRYFTVGALALFILVQALGHTSLSDASPVLTSENLLVLLTPLVIIFGTGFFLTLLDQMKLPAEPLKYLVMALLLMLAGQPLLTTLVQKVPPVDFPPYYPPEIQEVAGWMSPNELMMSDIPWAVAWYGQRQCVWMTRNADDSFYAINDYLKPIGGLYLTAESMNQKFFTQMARAGKHSWGHFILNAGLLKKFPKGFPLTTPRVLDSGLFLTDHPRWQK